MSFFPERGIKLSEREGERGQRRERFGEGEGGRGNGKKKFPHATVTLVVTLRKLCDIC